ncbi:MAG: diguanylate cyclase, partial [Synechococcus sp. SB0662_bin_45]|nr:diguanylate cyclase [Synechococcus sp. SB0662_bin_45]
MDLDVAAKMALLKTIPHGLFICGVAEGGVVNGFTASWVTQGSFKPPLVVMGVRSDS